MITVYAFLSCVVFIDFRIEMMFVQEIIDEWLIARTSSLLTAEVDLTEGNPS
jgi:hypothetical protein